MQTNNELDAQRVATEFTFRKRLREMESFYSELKWQEKNVSVTTTPLPSPNPTTLPFPPCCEAGHKEPCPEASVGSPSVSLAGGEQ